MSQKLITIDGTTRELTITREGASVRSGELALEIVEMRRGEAVLKVGDRQHVVPFHIDGSRIAFSFDGELYSAEVVEKGTRVRAHHRDHSTSAPMPGLVLKILAAAGASVDKGAPLVILEAMKMEHTITAPRDGVVKAVHCREGEMVQPGVELVELE